MLMSNHGLTRPCYTLDIVTQHLGCRNQPISVVLYTSDWCNAENPYLRGGRRIHE